MSEVTSESHTANVQEGSLVHFHMRFGHLSFDTIE